VCGSTIKLTNVFLAWTDASGGDKNKCPAILANPNGISPKCGKAAEILVTTPPSAPMLTRINPGCGQTTGSITISNTAGLLYSVNGGAFAPYPAGGYTNLVPGNYSIVAKNVEGCTSAASAVTINAAPPTPGKPTLSAVQPTCTVLTGKITVTSSTSGLEFSLDGNPYAPYPAGGYTVGAGEHTLRAKNSDDCVSELASITINAQPPPPVAQAGSPFIKTCIANPNGKQIGEAPAAGFTYSWSPSTGLSDANVSDPTANPSTTTTYTVTKTNTQTGCSATDQVTVTVNTTKPEAVAGNDFTKTCVDNVDGGKIGETADAGFTYEWTSSPAGFASSAANPTVKPSVTTTYTVTKTNTETGCSDTDQVTVTVNNAPVVAQAGSPFTKTCTDNENGGQIGEAPAAGFTYSWTSSPAGFVSSAANPTVDPSVTTTYTVTKTNTQTGCSATDQVTVTVNTTKPEAEAGNDFTKTCVANVDGKQIGEASAAGFTYSWSPSTGLSAADVSDPTANPSTTTTYTVTKTNTQTGCFDIDQVTVTVNTAKPEAAAGADFTKTCVDNENGKQIGEAPAAGFSYAWSPATGLSDTDVSNPMASPSTTTTYTVTKTNTQTGCFDTDQVTVTVNNTPVVAQAGNPFTKTCIDNENGGQIGEAPTAGFTYAWTSSPAGFASSAANPTVNPSVTTTYTVTKTNTQTGCSATDQVTVTVNTTKPEAAAGNDFTKTCVANVDGKQIGEASAAGFTYSWSPSTGLSDADVSNPTANPSTTTTYTVTKTNTATGCFDTDQVIVTVNTTKPEAEAGNPFTKTCIANVDGKQIGEATEAGFSYAWSPATGLSDTDVSNPTANPSTTTTYTVTKTNMATGCADTDQVIVTVNTTKPEAVAGNDFTKTCVDNENGKQIGEASAAGFTYSWSPSTGLSNADVSNPTANPSTTTTYTVTKTDTETGCADTDQVTVTVNTTKPVAAAGSDFTKTCVANPNGKQIGEAPAAGFSYAWSPATGLSDSDVSNPMANPSVTTTYTVTKTNTATGCADTDQVIVTVNTTKPEAVAGNDFTKTCVDNENGKQIGEASAAGFTYSWSPSTGLSNADVSNPTANPSGTTTYTVTKTDTETGCADTDQVTVTVDNTKPVLVIANPAAVCAPSTVNITAPAVTAGSSAGALTYWTDAGATVALANPGAVGTGTYYIKLTSAGNGCFVVKPVTVTVNPKPTLHLTQTPVKCNGNADGKITATFNGGPGPYYIKIDAGTYGAAVTSPYTFTGLTAGNHTVTVKNGNGCEKAAVICITSPALLTLSCGAGSPQTNCAAPNGSLSVKAAGGTGPYQYSINNGAFSSATASTTYTFNSLAAGTYTLKVKDANGCIATATCGVKTGGFRTQTQGGWGADPSGGNPGTYMRQVVTINGVPKSRFDHAFPNGVTVGDVVPFATDNCAGNTLKLMNLNGVKGVDAVTAFLPSGGTARKLDKNYVNPGGSYSNVFAGQVVALTLSVGFDNKFSDFGASTTLLKNLYVNLDPFKGLTVGQVLAEANKALGGCYSKFTITQLNNAVSAINENFVDGQIKGSILVCATPKPVVASAGREGVDLEGATEAAPEAITVTAFPNPAYGEATIQFTVAKTGPAVLDVYNTRGDKVKTLFNGVAEGGKAYQVTLRPDDRIVPGAYIYRVQAGADSKASRLIMLKQ
jgi:hypothetical protein